MRRIERGALAERDVEALADSLGVSSRHLRRSMMRELGTTPLAVETTRRLSLARQLLTDTSLSITAVAHASGFGSLRRFNAAYRDRYGAAPSRARTGKQAASSEGAVTVRLAYRPPFDFAALLGFLSARAIVGVESVDDASYATTLAVGDRAGWISVVDDPARAQLVATISTSLAPALLGVVSRLRALFDLDARPHDIAAVLARDAVFVPEKQRLSGLRVPGTTSGFALAVRAVLGQQVSVKEATTLMARLVAATARPIETSIAALTRLAPTPDDVIAAGVDRICACGVVRARAEAIVAIAARLARDPQLLEPYADADAADRALAEIAGIGPWTRGYLALRALRDPDAYPVGDLVLCKRMGVTKQELARRSEAWRPWRAYAAMWLWNVASDGDGKATNDGGRDE